MFLKPDFAEGKLRPMVIYKLYPRLAGFEKKYLRHLTDVVLGVYYGYPDCCIKEYISVVTETYNRSKASKFGFIPCEAHARRVFAGEDIESFIQGRVCSTPFRETSTIYDPEAKKQLLKGMVRITKLKNLLIKKDENTIHVP